MLTRPKVCSVYEVRSSHSEAVELHTGFYTFTIKYISTHLCTTNWHLKVNREGGTPSDLRETERPQPQNTDSKQLGSGFCAGPTSMDALHLPRPTPTFGIRRYLTFLFNIYLYVLSENVQYLTLKSCSLTKNTPSLSLLDFERQDPTFFRNKPI
ncbi:hypothetical protein STEG23_024501 [Scotinomys teguina]